MKKFISILLATILAVSAFSFASAQTVSDTRAGFGMSISGFKTTDLEGNAVDSAIIENAELTFLNYWATWCGPCVSEMPHINQLYQYTLENPDYGVQIVGAISEGNGCTPATALAFLKQHNYNWLNLRADAVLSSVFSTCAYVPQTLIIDGNGIVRDHMVGSFPSYDMLKEYVDMWLDVIRNHDGDTCTITFKDIATDNVITTLEVPYGGVIEVPEAPVIEGQVFNGWQIDPDDSSYELDENILVTHYDPYYLVAMGDATIYGSYTVQRFLVRFYDTITNTLINQQMVNYGQAATAPEAPQHPGYTFAGWDTDFSFVTGNLKVYAIYEQGSIPGDIDGNGIVSTADAVTILRMAIGLIEVSDAVLPIADMNSNGSIGMDDAILALRIALSL